MAENEADEVFMIVVNTAWQVLSSTAITHKNKWFDIFFKSVEELFSALTQIVNLTFAPGLLTALTSDIPPVLNFFKSLPTHPIVRKRWGIYLVVLKKAGEKALIYIGSGTCFLLSIQGRIRDHEKDIMLPSNIERLQKEGYEVTHRGLLCWADTPTWIMAPLVRLVFLLLEATFTYILWALAAPPGGNLLDSCFWEVDTLTYGGLCSHSCLYEGVRGQIDLQCTDEELEIRYADWDKLRRLKKAEHGLKWHHKQMNTNWQSYSQKANDRKRAARAARPEQYLAVQRAATAHAIKTAKHRCELCNHNFCAEYALQNHLKGKKHAARLQTKNSPFRCWTCLKGFARQDNLRRHERAQSHKAMVAHKAQKAAEAMSDFLTPKAEEELTDSE